MTVTIPEVATAMQTLLTRVADELGQTSGFIKRKRRLSGASFAQTLVFGYLDNPASTTGEMSVAAATVGVKISRQGLDQRFTETAARFMQALMEEAVQTAITSEGVDAEVVKRFKGIYILDSSVVTLPEALSAIWSGCGGRTETTSTSAVKLSLRFNWSAGELDGPYLSDGRTHDRKAAGVHTSLPSGALSLADLGYFCLKDFAAMGCRGVYWITRYKSGTCLYTPDGRRLHLLDYLRQHDTAAPMDIEILLGSSHRLFCRLIAVPVPAEIVRQRRQRLAREAEEKGQSLSFDTLALAEWTVLLTNAPRLLLRGVEVLILGTLRWQIELVFKLWKSDGLLDEWRSLNPWHILCEFYAKLIALLIQHWVTIIGCWHHLERSLHQAALAIRKFAFSLALALPYLDLLCQTLATIQRCLDTTVRMTRRRSKPHTFERLSTGAIYGLS